MNDELEIFKKDCYTELHIEVLKEMDILMSSFVKKI